MRKIDKSSFILLLLIVTSMCARAQQTFVLMPDFGMGSGFCHYNFRPQNTDWFTFKKYGADGGSAALLPFNNTQYGLLLEMKRQGKKCNFATGITTGIATYGYDVNLGQQYDTVFGTTVKGPVKDGVSRSFMLIRIPFYVMYNIKTFIRDEKDSIVGKLYNFHHKNTISIIGGISFNYAVTAPINFPDAKIPSTITTGNDSVRFLEYYYYQNRIGISVNAGLVWTLYSSRTSKEILAFTLYYEQGTLNMVNADLYFYKNGVMTHRQLGSRGSQLQLNIAIPITLNKGCL